MGERAAVVQAMTLPDLIRAKAKEQGIGVDELRERLGLGGSTFYDLLRGELPRTRKIIEKLRAGGIEVPPDALLTG
jgi:lambda repressor-like predicted transcriptional regulator